MINTKDYGYNRHNKKCDLCGNFVGETSFIACFAIVT